MTEAWHWFTWSDHGVIDATAFFTLALVVVGSIQLGLFLWQLRLIRKSLIDAQESADAAAKAAEAATRQARVAEDSLTKLERPYLFVFNLSPLEVDEIEDPEDIEGGYWLKVKYSVANYGKIPAIIKHAQAGFSTGVEPISPTRLEYNHTLVASPIFASDEPRHGIEEWLRWKGNVQNDEYMRLYPDLKDEELFFWVIITYRGPFSDQHETRACWRYDQSTNRFIGPFGGREYSGEK